MALAALFGALVCAALPAHAAATFPGKNGPVVFNSFKGELMAISPQGRDLRSLSPGNKQGDFQPSVSPDGETAVFSRFRAEGGDDLPTQLFTVPVAGGTAQPLPLFGLQPAFSGPAGRRIAFQAYSDDHLVLAAADGSSERRLTKGRKRADDDPAFSPNGRKVAFDATSRRRGTEVMLVKSNGKEARTLTDTKRGDSSDPCFSPDGKRIVFTRWEKSSDRHAIWVMRSDGRKQRQLTSSKDESFMPAFSPDGKKIVFVREQRRRWRLVIMRSDGKRERTLTPKGLEAENPDWAVR